MNLAIAPTLLDVPRAAAALDVDVVSDDAGLQRLQPAWDQLAEQAGVDHPFLTPEWIRTWWECFGDGRELQVLAVRDRGALVGLFPLMRDRLSLYGLRARRLGSLYNPHVPRSGGLVARGVRGVVAAAWRHLAGRRDWDVLEFCQLADDSGAAAELRARAEADGFRTGVWRARPSPYVAIRGSWDAYYGGLRSKHRANLRNRAKRLGPLGEIELELVSAHGSLAGALEDGFRLEAAAWKERAGTAIAAHPELRRFYTRLAERMARRGWLRLQFLSVNRRRIAFGYSLCYRNRLFLLKPGYDPDYAQYSPGTLLLERVLRDAFDRGLAEHDFLGVDDPWKREWTGQARAHGWFYAFPRTLRGELLHALKFRIVPGIRGRDA